MPLPLNPPVRLNTLINPYLNRLYEKLVKSKLVNQSCENPNLLNKEQLYVKYETVLGVGEV